MIRSVLKLLAIDLIHSRAPKNTATPVNLMYGSGPGAWIEWGADVDTPTTDLRVSGHTPC